MAVRKTSRRDRLRDVLVCGAVASLAVALTAAARSHADNGHSISAINAISYIVGASVRPGLRGCVFDTPRPVWD